MNRQSLFWMAVILALGAIDASDPGKVYCLTGASMIVAFLAILVFQERRATHGSEGEARPRTSEGQAPGQSG